MIENQEGNHPNATPNTLNPDIFVFQIGGGLDRRRNDKCAVQFIGQAGDKNGIESPGHGAQN